MRLLRSLSPSSAALCLVTNVAAAVTNVGRLPNASHEIAFFPFLLPPPRPKKATNSLTPRYRAGSLYRSKWLGRNLEFPMKQRSFCRFPRHMALCIFIIIASRHIRFVSAGSLSLGRFVETVLMTPDATGPPAAAASDTDAVIVKTAAAAYLLRQFHFRCTCIPP